jgi:hypothetical protein
MVAEHKQGFLRLMAEKLYRERQITATGARIRELKQEHDLKPPYTQAEIEAHPKMFRRYLQHQHTGMIPRQE